MIKACKKCGDVKPLTEFHKNSALEDGRVNSCKACVCARTAAWVAANPERHRANGKAYQTANAKIVAARLKSWVENNRERSLEIKSAWKKRNPETVRMHARNAARKDPAKQAARKKAYLALNRHVANAYLQRRRSENPNQRVNDAMGNRMREVLRRGKAGVSWRKLVGYDISELTSHLESLFAPCMTWENYGKWHIDHRRPVASFDFSSDMVGTVRECWALSNLQPLWALDNIRKGAKW